MRDFFKALDESITATSMDMGEGQLKRDSADATAMLYCEQVGLIRGLQLAKDLCKQVEDRLIRGK